MDEKWHQHDIMVIIIGELHSSWKKVVAILKLQLNYNWVATSCTIYTMSCNSYNSCNFSNSTHTIEIWWIAIGHCNSKTELQS